MKLKFVYLLPVVAVFLAFSFYVSAQETEEVLPEAGLTPASPLHVFERLGDWVRLNVLTFNAVRKAEVKIEITEKRAAELKAVVETGEASDVIERAESFVRVRAEEVERDLERLDSEGRNIDSLIEKFNDLSLRRQAVLEDVLERAPERAKEALARAIEHSQRGLEKAEEALRRQVEKGLIEEEKAKEIFERTVERLKAQVEHRSEHLDDLAEELGEVPPEIRERFEVKLKHLEDRLVNVESKEELKEIRDELKNQVKDAASSVLELRARHKLSDEVGDELLRDIERDRFDVAKKAAEVTREAGEDLAEIKAKIARAESEGKNIPQNVSELVSNAERHLANAKDAFENKNFGEAFGQANAARHNIKSAKRFLEHLLEGKDRAQKAIEEAKEEIVELEIGYEVTSDSAMGNVLEAALKMLEAAKLQLRQAEAALAEGNLERAFAHAKAAERMADRGKDILDREEDVFEKRRELEEKATDVKKERFEQRIKIESVLPSPVVSPASKSAEELSAKIRITNSGFEPREVKLRVGGTVVWTNESGTASWPASVVHPTHSVYPQGGGCIGSAFDACGRIENGGTYEFRFDHIGTWRYHNHVNPGMTGAVTVVE